MISKSFKKQLIVNNYKTQFIPETDEIFKNSFDAIQRKINLLLFRINNKSLLDESLWVGYKDKNNTIEYNIRGILKFLIVPFYSIYYYSRYEKYNIQENISFNIKNALEFKYYIENSPNYTEYLDNIS